MRVISRGEGFEAARCGRVGKWDGFGTGRGERAANSERCQQGQEVITSADAVGLERSRVGGRGEHRETLRVGRDQGWIVSQDVFGITYNPY